MSGHHLFAHAAVDGPVRRAVVAAGIVICAALSFGGAAAARADDDDLEALNRSVIQNRKFRMGAELTLQGGVLPLDPFFKGLSATGRFTWHFNDFHAWEVAAGTYAFNLDSGITEQLLNNFGVQRAALPALNVVAESNYVVTPFYGKFALVNRTLLYQEVFAVAGATVTYWSDNTFRPGPDVGAGMRFFVTDWFSLRGDIRYALVFNQVPIINPKFSIDGVLFLGAGFSLNVGG